MFNCEIIELRKWIIAYRVSIIFRKKRITTRLIKLKIILLKCIIYLASEFGI